MHVDKEYHWDNECSRCPGGRDCTKCYKTAMHDHKTRLGIMTANCVRRALRDGIKHYDIKSRKLLTTPEQILNSMLINGSIVMEEPKKGNVSI